jgi:serralysin
MWCRMAYSIMCLLPGGHDNLLIGASTSVGCQVIRLTPAGVLDTTFGGGSGITTIPGSFSCGDMGTVGLAIQPTPSDNYILVGGAANGVFAVARLASNGSLDNTFGSNGIAQTKWCGSANDSVESVALDAAGNIFAAGRAQWSTPSTTINFGIAKYTPNGLPDTTFGYVLPGATQPAGKVAFDITGLMDKVRSVLVQSDGKVVVSGLSQVTINGTTTFPFSAIRLNPDGSLDTTFGSGNGNAGVVLTAPYGTVQQAPFRMSLDHLGRLLQGGSSRWNMSGYNTTLLRYIP